MSKTYEYASGHFPVHGLDIQITGYTAKFVVINHEFGKSPEKTVMRNGSGDTKIRVHSDLEQSKTLSLTCVVIGADAAGASANNAPVESGTVFPLTSTQHPAVVGDWTVQSCRQGQGNADIAAWVFELLPKIV